jgi:hypothetical protein
MVGWLSSPLSYGLRAGEKEREKEDEQMIQSLLWGLQVAVLRANNQKASQNVGFNPEVRKGRGAFLLWGWELQTYLYASCFTYLYAAPFTYLYTGNGMAAPRTIENTARTMYIDLIFLVTHSETAFQR